jgi:hypothetical protein
MAAVPALGHPGIVFNKQHMEKRLCMQTHRAQGRYLMGALDATVCCAGRALVMRAACSVATADVAVCRGVALRAHVLHLACSAARAPGGLKVEVSADVRRALDFRAEPTVPRCGCAGGSCSGGCSGAGVFCSPLIARRTAAARSGVALLRVAFTSVLSWAFFLAASLRADWASRKSFLQKIDFPIAACGFLSRGVHCLTGGRSSSDGAHDGGGWASPFANFRRQAAAQGSFVIARRSGRRGCLGGLIVTGSKLIFPS